MSMFDDSTPCPECGHRGTTCSNCSGTAVVREKARADAAEAALANVQVRYGIEAVEADRTARELAAEKATSSALAKACNDMEAQREYNAQLVAERDAALAAARNANNAMADAAADALAAARREVEGLREAFMGLRETYGLVLAFAREVLGVLERGEDSHVMRVPDRTIQLLRCKDPIPTADDVVAEARAAAETGKAKGLCWSDVNWCAEHGQPLWVCTEQGREGAPAAPAAEEVPCTCHYESAEFCRYHGPLLKAERAAPAAETEKARCCDLADKGHRAGCPGKTTPAQVADALRGETERAENWKRVATDRFERLTAAEVRIAELEAALQEARAIIDRDRTGLAAGLNAAINATRSYWWIANGEWSGHHYTEQNEKTLRAEVKNAFVEIAATAAKALSESGRLATEACRAIDARLAARATPQTGEARICDNCKRAAKAKDGRTDRGIPIGPCYCDTLPKENR